MSVGVPICASVRPAAASKARAAARGRRKAGSWGRRTLAPMTPPCSRLRSLFGFAAAGQRATGFVGLVRARLHPDGAPVRRELVLEDRHLRLDLLYPLPAGRERLLAVGRGGH